MIVPTPVITDESSDRENPKREETSIEETETHVKTHQSVRLITMQLDIIKVRLTECNVSPIHLSNPPV